MTLLDIATFICVKVNQTDPEDISAAKGFAQRRFQMIWQDQLWKDSLIEYTQTLGAADYVVTDTWLPEAKTLLLPTLISIPIAARTDTGKLNVESPEIFYRMDFDTFASTGVPRQYRLLSPVVWQTEAVLALRFYSSAISGTGFNTVDSLNSDGISIDRNTFNNYPFPLSTSRLDAISKPTGQTLSAIDFGDSGLTILTIGSDPKNAPKHQRLQFFGAMPKNAVIRVLGKANPPSFLLDGDEPGLTGVENCLLAFVQSDMLQRERQYGKAQAVQAEAVQLLEQLKREQVAQQANNKRLIPEDGYGGGVWGPTGASSSFGEGWEKVSISEEVTVSVQRLSGTMNLPVGETQGHIEVGLLFTPAKCDVSVMVPSGGQAIDARVVFDTLSTAGCDYVLTGTPDTNGYVLSYEFIAET